MLYTKKSAPTLADEDFFIYNFYEFNILIDNEWHILKIKDVYIWKGDA